MDRAQTRGAGLRTLVLMIGVVIIAASASAQVQFVKIEGNRLTIHVGADASFQIFNSDVPGSGQIYPSSCANTADMGVFAFANGRLIAPNFTSHGCGTATSGLGSHLNWNGTVSAVSGIGTASSPFVVTVNASSTGGVSLAMTVQYVNGQNYFRLNTTFSGSASGPVSAFIGADIYLAASDAGVFYYDESLRAPGGRDCGNPPTYNILLIPVTPPQRYTASNYSDVWRQIGSGTLDGDVSGTTCVDNGAALQWENILAGRSSATIKSAVSFGEIPPASAFADRPFVVTVLPAMTVATAGETVLLDVTTGHLDPEFNSALTLSLEGFPEEMAATIDPTEIKAPGDGAAKVTVKLSPDIFPRLYSGLSVVATSGELKAAGSAGIDVVCDPPMVLAVDYPKNQIVKKGETAKLHIDVHRGMPVRYQWYSGHSPNTRFPIQGANSADYTTPPVNGPEEYWVRLSNACGSFDTLSATVTPAP